MALVDRVIFVYGERQRYCGGGGKRSFAYGQAGIFSVPGAVGRGSARHVPNRCERSRARRRLYRRV